MELRALKIFKDLACERSFVKVARQNFLTQPSISAILKQLEEELKTRLFDRAPRKVVLTKTGELLLPHVEELLSRAGDLKSLAAQTQNIVAGDLRIGTIYSIGMYELAPSLKKFMKAYPEIHILLQYERSDVLYDLLLRNKIDLAFVAYPKSRTGVQITPFGTDQMVLITAPDHPLAKQKSVYLKNIEGERFIAFDPGIPTREALDKVLGSRGIRVSIRMTNDNVDTLKRAVEIGLGISIVPYRTIREEEREGTLCAIQIRDLRLERPLGILTPKGRAPSQPSQLFIQTLSASK